MKIKTILSTIIAIGFFASCSSNKEAISDYKQCLIQAIEKDETEISKTDSIENNCFQAILKKHSLGKDVEFKKGFDSIPEIISARKSVVQLLAKNVRQILLKREFRYLIINPWNSDETELRILNFGENSCSETLKEILTHINVGWEEVDSWKGNYDINITRDGTFINIDFDRKESYTMKFSKAKFDVQMKLINEKNVTKADRPIYLLAMSGKTFYSVAKPEFRQEIESGFIPTTEDSIIDQYEKDTKKYYDSLALALESRAEYTSDSVAEQEAAISTEKTTEQ